MRTIELASYGVRPFGMGVIAMPSPIQTVAYFCDPEGLTLIPANVIILACSHLKLIGKQNDGITTTNSPALTGLHTHVGNATYSE